MPQTREHFEICRLLHVPAGLVVDHEVATSPTAACSTSSGWRFRSSSSGSFLDDAPVVVYRHAPVKESRSSVEPSRRLRRRRRRRRSLGPPRLPIDRVFSLKGFGTVVTGTLLTGRLAHDDEVVLQPSGRTVKVRGLHVHGESQDEAIAGQRVAANLAGVEVSDIVRGETLTALDAVTVTRRADVRVELLPSARPLGHGARVRFHQGTRELLGRIVVPDAAQSIPDRRPGRGSTSIGPPCSSAEIGSSCARIRRSKRLPVERSSIRRRRGEVCAPAPAWRVFHG